MADFMYEVTLSNMFDAQDHQDAVRQMIEWLESEDPWGMSFRVQREHQDSDWQHIDGRDLWRQENQ